MPNWCSNTIVVSGEDADVAEFNQWLGDGTGLLNKIKPTPQPLVDTVSGFIGDPDEQKKLEEKSAANVKEYGYANWYDWNIANWGTKWDVDVEVDDSSSISEQVIFSFESAWSPPQRAISDLADKFNKLDIRHSYFEEGCGFVGYDLYEKGELTREEYNEDSQSDEWKQLAQDEFGWEPWPDDEDEMLENEEGKATETPKTVVGEVLDIISNFSKETRDRVKKTKKKVKKTAVKKTSKKTTKKVAKKKKKK